MAPNPDKSAREVLLENQAPFNQMRNTIYHLIRFIRDKGARDVPGALQRMGRNAARTMRAYWEPDPGSLEDQFQEAYRFVVGSKVKVRRDQRRQRVVRVEDKKCRFCKYDYEDVDLAGCEIVVGFMVELFGLAGGEVVATRTRGDSRCVHEYRVEAPPAPAPVVSKE